MKSTLTLTGAMSFDVELDGHHFPIDAEAQFGGENAGPRPKGLVLSALAGCAGMDVISILRKMRQTPTSMKVSVEADKAETHPKVLEHFRVTIELEGGVDPKKAWRAVALSRDQYCAVAAMLRAHSDLSYRVLIDGVDVAEPTS